MAAFLASVVFISTAIRGEPNPPTWPPSVNVFEPGNDGDIQGTINEIFQMNGGHNPAFNGQFSSDRYVLLFKPGTYNIDVNVGYYTHLMGMGKSPTDVKIENVICENGNFDYSEGALSNFWRSAENFMTTPTLRWNNQITPSMMWAVSQASPLRRVYINGDINLWQYNYGCCAGYASGGYLSDSIVTGTVSSGAQQQWITRNAKIGNWDGGNYNMVHVGVQFSDFTLNCSPNAHCSNKNGQPHTVIEKTPSIAEKPYIHHSDGKYYLMIPQVESNKRGSTEKWGEHDKSVSFSDVYVVQPTDSAAEVNEKLRKVKHLVITPGMYNWTEPIKITQSDSVVLGLGIPSLISAAGNPVIVVASGIDGVRIAGLLLEAGPRKSETLMSVGLEADRLYGNYEYDETNPTILYDIFGRVGGRTNPKEYQVSTTSMVDIHNDHVIVDDMWLWRADHDITGLVYNSDNPVDTGIRVYGNSVITYGLAVEHTLKDMVQWNGNYGEAFFFQSEFPYDVTPANYGDKNYVAFRVNGTGFRGWGMGAYSYFRDHAVTVANGIMTPVDAMLVNPLTVFLNGNGQITHVWNNQGNKVSGAGQQSYIC